MAYLCEFFIYPPGYYCLRVGGRYKGGIADRCPKQFYYDNWFFPYANTGNGVNGNDHLHMMRNGLYEVRALLFGVTSIL